MWVVHKSVNVPGYSRITSAKVPSLCMTTFSTSFANRMVLLLQSHNCSYYINANEYWQRHRSDCRNILIYAQKTSHNFMTCDIRLDSLKLPAPEVRDFVEIPLHYLDCLGSRQNGITLQGTHPIYCYLISFTYSSVTSCVSNCSQLYSNMLLLEASSLNSCNYFTTHFIAHPYSTDA